MARRKTTSPAASGANPASVRKSSTLRAIVVGVLAFLAVILLAVAWMAHFATTQLEIPPAARQFKVEQGVSFKSIANQLVDAGVLRESISFVVLGRFMGKANAVKAGTYELPERLTPQSLLTRFARGEVAQSEITFIEGWTFTQMRGVLDAHPGVRHDTRGMTDSEVMRRLKLVETQPEGLFAPDTYHFATGASDLQILARAYQTLQTRLNAAWEKRNPDLPYETPYDALIMASIVEKETGRPEDRRTIAAVFVNRLKRGMRLQTDPAVIYGLGAKFDGNLRRRDLEADGPYNTYMRAGLPPTPVSMPGQASIEAALDPAPTPVLYFVARGDGTSQFSRSLEEHNRAVRKYQLKH